MSLRAQTEPATNKQLFKAQRKSMCCSLLLTICICGGLYLTLTMAVAEKLCKGFSTEAITCSNEKAEEQPHQIHKINYQKKNTAPPAHKRQSPHPVVFTVFTEPIIDIEPLPEYDYEIQLVENENHYMELMQDFETSSETISNEMIAWFNFYNEDLEEEPETPPVNPPKAVASEQNTEYTPVQYLAAPKPAYPQEMKRKRIKGTVRLRIHVNDQGMPTAVEIIDSPHRDFSEAAEKQILKAWRFVPARRNGKATAETVISSIIFD